MKTPYELMEELEQLKADLATEADRYRQLSVNLVNIRHEYKKSYYKKYLQVKAEFPRATINDIEAMTYPLTESENLDYELAKTLAEAQKEILNCVKAHMDTTRTQLSWYKEELRNT